MSSSQAAQSKKKSASTDKNKPRKIGVTPVHPIASFPSVRKRVDLLSGFNIRLADLFPPGVKLTANQLKVLLVLKASAVGRTDFVAIDQGKIAEISGIERPNVARAIAGLRKKGVIKETLMEPGLRMYRNIYKLWSPPEMVERDGKAMLNRKRRAKAIKQKAITLEQQAHPDAAKLREQAKEALANTCPWCGGEGAVLVYLPTQGRDRARWCNCPIGIKKAQKAGFPTESFIPDELLESRSEASPDNDH